MRQLASQNRSKEFNLRVQNVLPDTKEYQVLNFVRSGDLMPMRQMVVWTLEMCWLPWAYQQKEADQETLKQVALDAAYQLERHLNYLRDTFGLERPAITQTQPILLKAESSRTNEPALDEELPGEYDLESLGFSDFDELSGEMFKSGSISIKAKAA